jgi:rare lipoprotein A
MHLTSPAAPSPKKRRGFGRGEQGSEVILLSLLLLLLLSACTSSVRFARKVGGGERPESRPVPRRAAPEEGSASAQGEKGVQRPGPAGETVAAACEAGAYGRFFQEGVASYYAEEFNGRQTANGETFDMNDLTAAHQTLPFNTRVRVENQGNGKCIVVRINDRGPYKKDRIIDLSLAGAKSIGLIGSGSANVKLFLLDR